VNTLRFAKGQGTGNDFVLVEDFDGALGLSPKQIARLCDRHFGVGADGLILVTKTAAHPEVADLLENEPAAEWFMDYRNSDGTPAEMCGNGARVFARYLLEHNLAAIADGRTLAIATRAGVKDITRAAMGFAVDLGEFRIDYKSDILVQTGDDPVARPSLGVNVGNPHQVVVLADVNELRALNLTRPPRFDPELAEGANVEYVVLQGVADGVGKIQMRVYERGVGETLSCGTGIAAAAIAVRHWSGGSQNHWKVEVPGGLVAVRVWPAENGERVSISGPAELTYSGEFNWND
jgi:diaminopimelate epimerase